MNLLILRVVAAVNLYLVFILSLYFLLRGHNHPGGGFIAGLVAVTGLIVQALAFGRERAARLVRVDPGVLVALGLLLAAGTGVGAVVLGFPFLTHTFGFIHVPIIGEVEWATAVLFDIGVYLVVVGVMHWIVLAVSGYPGGRGPEGGGQQGPERTA